MANRPVFLSTENKPFVETIDTEFEYHSGFSIGQKRKSISSLHENTTKVRNIRAYLLTSLYNAPTTINSYYTALVNHDMYGSG